MNEIKSFDLQRRVVAHMTTKSWKNIPHVSYMYEPDITEFYKAYQELFGKKNVSGYRLSFNTMILRALTDGLKSAPKLNAFISYNYGKGEGTLKVSKDINICVPWLLPDGRMITPVILNAESKDLGSLSEAVAELEKKIKNTNVDELLYKAVVSDTWNELKKFNLFIFRRIIASKMSLNPIKGLSGKDKEHYYNIPEINRLSPDNLLKGTVTISNIGSLYREQSGCFGLLQIVPPQVFAIGVGAVQEKPGVFIDSDGEKKIGIRKILPMCLAFDHRALDFNALVPFLKTMDYIFSKPDIIDEW